MGPICFSHGDRGVAGQKYRNHDCDAGSGVFPSSVASGDSQSGPPTTGMSSAPYIVLGFAANHKVKLLQYYNGLVTENSFDSIYPLWR